MDPFELLKKDHKKVSDLLKRLDKTEESDASTREELFGQLKNELETHTHIEETILYPALKDQEETKDITLEAYEEHNVVKTLLQELDETSKDDENWGAKLTVLKENVEHHVEEEEGEMFKKAKKVLNKDEREALGDRINEAKTGRAEGEGSADEEEELVNTGAVREIRSARGARIGGGSASSQPSRLRASSKKRSMKAAAGSKKKTSVKKKSSKKK